MNRNAHTQPQAKPLNTPPSSSVSWRPRSYALFLLLLFGFFSGSTHVLAYNAPQAQTAPIIDGVADDSAWQTADWANMDSVIIGDAPEADDFSARFKVVWTPQRIYILAEIVDDTLLDTTANPLDRYWEDDTLEILIDEDASGGPHLDNHNAMAYHIALDNTAVDIGTDGEPFRYEGHIQSRWQRSLSAPNKLIWEVSLAVHNDTFTPGSDSSGVTLTAGKRMGFLLAYCDADVAGQGRDTFISSADIAAVDGDKNRAYFDADVFDQLLLTP